MSVSQITTHILDTGSGRPAADVPVILFAGADGAWNEIARGVTDADGRIKNLGPESVTGGTYKLNFATGAYYEGQGQSTFFPEVELTFAVADTGEHYHVPLLLSPFAFSTYRGS
ncbi:5-hydroxyisourate hydrolase [Arthrobacter woluwensis]|uniref:hydroxyisourate hydrolase n=1 Tax=Arthrobacter woluwensis TaxID=156980 RepID=UPI00278A2906|nr:hydroxyisourate hydrolase [Arthrobacter woluwensis]MDQ0710048.1 5-hydroxyisourate hydrolase [Arthrobacter woluwensis]